VLAVRRDADAGVADGEAQLVPRRRASRRRRWSTRLAAGVNFTALVAG
jgi:hypothetical protein